MAQYCETNSNSYLLKNKINKKTTEQTNVEQSTNDNAMIKL